VNIIQSRLLRGASLVLALAAWAAPAPARQDYIVTGSKPDLLFVVNPRTLAVQSTFHIPDADNWVATIVPSPDGRVAYVLTNRAESIAGIDLATGRQVFRADLSSPGERVKCMFAFDVTPDGRELIVYELPTKLDLAEYHVEEPRFAVFRTTDGVGAKAVRSFPAPRRVHMLLSRKSGRSFYALGFDLHEFDRRTGRQLSVRGIRNWDYADHLMPDLLALWPATEPTGVFVSPIYSATPNPAGGDPVPMTALMSLDLASGKLAYHDFEATSALIFSTVQSPVRPEVYGVYSQLTKVDTRHDKLMQRIDLDHTYYSVTVSSDGGEIYAGGAMCDIATYDSVTLARKADIRLPGCGDQTLVSMRVIRR
jgi:quinohemoprotein amine dehydrogenase beta subunit